MPGFFVLPPGHYPEWCNVHPLKVSRIRGINAFGASQVNEGYEDGDAYQLSYPLSQVEYKSFRKMLALFESNQLKK